MQQKLKFLFNIIGLCLIICATQLTANGQCTVSINNLPDTIKACKNTSIFLNPTLSSSSGNPLYIDTTWTPAAGLSNPNILNPSVSVGTTNATYVLTVQSVTPTNLLFNGDFTLGNTGFTSSYVYGTGGTWGLLSQEGQFAIATNANSTHINFANFGDHTSGTGNMLVVNGASAANVNIWCQTINVSPNTWYDFSAWGATCVASSPAILQFSINGNLTGTPLALPLTTGIWTQFHTTWFSGANTTIDICITDQQTAVSGNDFAIDDIEFKEICSVSDSVYIDVVNLSPAIQTKLILGCTADSVEFTAIDNGDIPNVYQWRFGDGNVSNVKNPTHVYAVQGPYTVTLYTLKSGCIDSAKVNINTAHPINAAFSANGNKPDSACIGTPIDVDAFLSQPNGFLTYAWDWGDGNTSNTGFSSTSHNYTQPGTYTILLTVTDTLGCTDTMTRPIFIDDAPYVFFTASDKEICVGESIFFKDSVAPFTSSFQWDFQDGTLVNDVHNPIRTFDLPGNIVVTLTGFYKVCPQTTHTENILIHAFPTVNLGEDTMMCPGLTGSILLSATSSPAASFVWNTQETSNSILITQPGHYWVRATEGDCATSDSIWVKQDCYLNIPNSFSPNGDGRNDYFLPREILSSGVSIFNLNIYNRWGENIFNTTKIDGRGWDGKYNDVLQPLGVYVYVIDVVFKQGVKKKFTGNVTLIR